MSERRAIALLPDRVARKIAAGEVIDRPASVLRELLDNAVDAGSRQVSVSWISGGLTEIKVIDDGWGMSREDLELCVLPHATSKIRSPEDLDDLRTLGFRGEALPFHRRLFPAGNPQSWRPVDKTEAYKPERWTPGPTRSDRRALLPTPGPGSLSKTCSTPCRPGGASSRVPVPNPGSCRSSPGRESPGLPWESGFSLSIRRSAQGALASGGRRRSASARSTSEKMDVPKLFSFAKEGGGLEQSGAWPRSQATCARTASTSRSL
jgi:hypothetical protein